MNKKIIFAVFVIILSLSSCAYLEPRQSVHPDAELIKPYIPDINNLFIQNNLKNAYVEADNYGRIKLKGEYEDENQVDLAFSLAQTTVGIKWLSPVTPENIKVKTWEKELEKLFPLESETLQENQESNEKVEIPTLPVKNKYALVVGIGKFKNEKINQLKYTAKDAEDFYDFITDPQRGAFPKKNVTLLTDEKATLDNIKEALDIIKKEAKRDDLVCLYMSSHGTPPNHFGGVFFVTYDSVVEPREKIWQTSISSKILEDFIQKIAASRLIIIMDACYSNGAYKDIPGFLPEGGKSLGIGDEDEIYGISEDYGKKLLGAKDIVLEETEPEIQEDLTEDESEGYGKVIITSSGPDEKSWESETISNSYFTYYFIEGLVNCKGAVQKAYYYAKPLVTQKVRYEKKHNQNPHFIATNKNWNIKISKK